MRGLFPVGAALAIAACSPAGSATGAPARTFAVTGFDSIRVAGSDTVKVVRGPAMSVVARGPAAQLDRLDIRTLGSALLITRKTGANMSRSNDPVVVTVTMPAILAAEVSGSGDVSIDRADGATFEARVSGSADLDIADLRAASTKLRISGSGNLGARGSTRVLSADISGSGNLDAEALIADTAAIAVQGSGDATAFAHRSATIAVSGSGNVRVGGTTQCTISTRGSGEARCTG
jgi:hypothetical protein